MLTTYNIRDIIKNVNKKYKGANENEKINMEQRWNFKIWRF